jgi:RloB-like protein
MARRGIVAKRATKDVDNRPVRWRRYPHLFLIVCEDGKTEPYYFDVFKRHIPNETIFLKTVGTGKSSKGVVEQAVIEKKKLSELSNKNVDEVWTVFDKDDADLVPANLERFNDAFKVEK